MRGTRTSTTLLVVGSVALCALSVTLLVLHLRSNMYDRAVIGVTRTHLKFARTHADRFFKEEGRFPSSVRELNMYIERSRAQGWAPVRAVEFISTPDGDDSDHRELDGTGGMCYDPATGEIKVNLVEPLKCYRRTYVGTHRNEIPADW